MKNESEIKEYFEEDKSNNKSKSLESVIKCDELSQTKIEVKNEIAENDEYIVKKEIIDDDEYIVKKEITEHDECISNRQIILSSIESDKELMEINKNMDIKCKTLEIGDFIISCKKESEENYKYDYGINVKSEQTDIDRSQYMDDISAMTIDQDSEDKIQDISENFNCSSDTNLNDKEIMERKNMYSCPECTFKTKSKHNYSLHVNKHNILICMICSRQFPRKPSLENHYEAMSFKCYLCEFANKIKENIKRHIQKKQGTDTDDYKCPNCSYQLNSETKMKSDILCNSFKENKLQCPMCSYKSEQKYNCRICTYTTKKICHFKRHLKTHLIGSTKQFECPKCAFRTDYKGNLKLHLECQHIDGKRYNCLSCNYKTNDRQCFKRHAVVHDNTRAYACNVCDKSFKRDYQLKRHSFTHFKEKRFHCAKCKFKSNHKDSLRIHFKNKHLGQKDKKYKCSKCLYETAYKVDLRRHLTKHLMDD